MLLVPIYVITIVSGRKENTKGFAFAIANCSQTHVSSV